MASNYNITIQFNPGNPMATWSIDDKIEALINAQVGDTLTFGFRIPDSPAVELSSAMLFAGPRKPAEAISPFNQTQIPLVQGSKVKVQNEGFYGFSIAFSTTDKQGVSNFYFLPDPELDVGST
ncbi:hypothetical protein LK542_17485 [Massilia sp. IC2-477]|uniref:hypothetical protein n=1 Tax=unclassified Massilia TaxID=2609279 RepID=UPI001D0F6673|nr:MULTISPECIES: hypothetical protein [unclassified Massilia]MCC2957412.1 hypothetical protein [Massilia sp. IC2-477]MCC2973894.1 hypothetical protein [Massilia sp. IC2-476]